MTKVLDTISESCLPTNFLGFDTKCCCHFPKLKGFIQIKITITNIYFVDSFIHNVQSLHCLHHKILNHDSTIPSICPFSLPAEPFPQILVTGMSVMKYVSQGSMLLFIQVVGFCNVDIKLLPESFLMLCLNVFIVGSFCLVLL